MKGVLKVGQEIEVRPGLVSKDTSGKLTCKPIRSQIVSLFAEENDLIFAAPGGLIGVGTKIDPTLCRADRMVGQVRTGRKMESFQAFLKRYFNCLGPWSRWSTPRHLHRARDFILFIAQASRCPH